MLHYGYRVTTDLKGGKILNINKRQIVMILNGLAIQQDLAHESNSKVPRSAEFSKFKEANEIGREVIRSGQGTMFFPEIDELFSQLVDTYRKLDEETDGETDLASLPPSEHIH
jgi:hypothetical protein